MRFGIPPIACGSRRFSLREAQQARHQSQQLDFPLHVGAAQDKTAPGSSEKSNARKTSRSARWQASCARRSSPGKASLG